MQRANPLIVAALLACLAAGCRDDSPDAIGPTLPSDQAAVAAAATHMVKNLGTLGGIQFEAKAIITSARRWDGCGRGMRTG